ncbi:MAG: tRNA (adenosine(37)-N6)-threonylcarbamoyltransferase complex dimerization subunit type 1 TsaB [Burkholderiales bacterium]|nr:tRNA (adenosine(37)-N6)-threonylcarbamoyltransferase complex dimerization subunit type 1 TsaB [Burkholderiales bacterium]
MNANATHVLAFDTSTERLAAGLQSPGGAPLTFEGGGGALASTTLLPRLRALLERAGIGWNDLGAIAFGVGPGAFTGLRTACSVAQGLGYGLGRPLHPIDSLLIVAEDARAQAGGDGDADFEVGVAMDARMDESYAGRYRWRDGRWQVVQAPALYDLDALAAAWSGAAPDAWAGSALAAFGDRLALAPAARRLTQEADRAAALLRLALGSAAAGAGIDADAALQLYLPDKVALTTAERAARAAAAGAAAARPGPAVPP